MTPRQKDLVQQSWEMVVPIADTAADLFYSRLFTIAPQVKPLFPTEMAEQKKKLMTTITVAVRGLDNLDRLVPVLEDLGRRHADYGVLDEHYEPVGAALIWTLGQGLGPSFTEETKEAWVAVYGVMCSVMQAAARAAA